MTDEQIRADEALYNARLRAFTDTLPQLSDIWVIGSDGRPVVSGTVFPMPQQMDLSDREYFRVHRDSPAAGVHVGEVVQARATNAQGRPRFFTLSRRRTGANGEFAGVTTISISPDYFAEYYARLTQPLVAALIRRDGLVLARYPALPRDVQRVTPDSPLMRDFDAGHEGGILTLVSALDGQERIFAYRKLPRVGIFATTGVDTADIRLAWLADMSRHLIFGLPATAAMVGLCLMALRRTRREATANPMLRGDRAARGDRGRAAPIAEDGSGRPAYRRHRARLQQPAHRDHRQSRSRAAPARRRGARARLARQFAEGGRARRDAGAAAARLLAPASARSEVGRHQPAGAGHVGPARRTLGETVTIETVLAGGLWKAAIDPNQLENTILNLAVNARDAMPDGGGSRSRPPTAISTSTISGRPAPKSPPASTSWWR